MRTFALCLLLTSSLLCAVPGTLHAEDDDTDIARLERRVEMLLDLVAELRTEVLELRERVAKLEAERGDTRIRVVDAEPEAVPATPIEPATLLVRPEVSGVYVLDREATIEAMTLGELDGEEDPETVEEIRLGIASMFEGMAITLRMEKNGTFFVRITEPGEDESTARGTWTNTDPNVVGSARLVLTTTHEDGVEQESPDAIFGALDKGGLRLEEGDGDSGFVMILRRK